MAIQYFMGVHRFATLLAVYGDTGWIPSQYRRWINIIRYWNRDVSALPEMFLKLITIDAETIGVVI